MTIEEKVKAYDKAFEIIKAYYNRTQFSSISDSREEIKTIEKAFPELKESEDERIRKALKEYFINSFQNNGVAAILGVHIKDILTWLEKQGEQKSFARYKVGDTIYYNSFGRLVSFTIANIVEDGTDNPMYEDGDGNSVFQNDIVEQNHAKFKVGDWVVGENGIVKQIDEFETYEGICYFTDRTSIHSKDLNYCRLWTIQDAKDGDVLAASDGSIFIFKDTIDDACKHYVALTTDNVVKFNEGLKHYWETSKAVHPATKEQRDTLMKAMADAGYTFDSEKKELKKIEQKPANKTEPKFKVGDYVKNVNDKREPIYEIVYMDKECYICEYRGKENIGDKAVMHFAFDCPYLRHTQKPVWSEKDEKILDNIEWALIDKRIKEKNSDNYEDELKWLKSIKDRVQPKQEWSEEDERYMEDVVEWIETFIDDEDCGDMSYEEHKEFYMKRINWLKSIRPQSRWKPSESDIRILEQVINGTVNPIDYHATLYAILEHLKNLREE